MATTIPCISRPPRDDARRATRGVENLSALHHLTVVVDDTRALIAAAADRIQTLSHSLAYAQAQAADAAAVEQIAAERQASAEQLRGALAAVEQTQTQA